MRARHAMRSPAPRPVAAAVVGLVLAASAAWAAPARAVDQPSTYPGCATRELRVPWGGAATVDLRDCQAFGLGVLNKFLEPQIGAVLGKILILALIILFIQKRPQGLFALKGRVID